MTTFTNVTTNYPEGANTPIKRVKFHAPPTSTTIKNFILGDEWLDTSSSPQGNWWKLTTEASGGLTWIKLSAGTVNTQTLTGNSGGAVGPTGGGTINLLGDETTVNIIGNPATNTLTVSTMGSVANRYNADSGFAIPSSNVLTVAGGNGINTAGAGSTLTFNITAPVSVANGGTGATTLTGVLTGNGTSAVTANTVTQHGVLIGGASNAVGSTSVGATGTVLIGTSGSDPSFSATPVVTSIKFGSGTALSVYQQGTWTPGITFGGGSTGITYSGQTGNYTRIGNLVFYDFYIVLTSKGSSTGTLAITGLPYTCNTSNVGPVAMNNYANLTIPAQFDAIAITTNNGGTTLGLTACGSGSVGIGGVDDTYCANNTQFGAKGFYIAA
jgi:hypothetical protein